MSRVEGLSEASLASLSPVMSSFSNRKGCNQLLLSSGLIIHSHQKEADCKKETRQKLAESPPVILLASFFLSASLLASHAGWQRHEPTSFPFYVLKNWWRVFQNRSDPKKKHEQWNIWRSNSWWLTGDYAQQSWRPQCVHNGSRWSFFTVVFKVLHISPRKHIQNTLILFKIWTPVSQKTNTWSSEIFLVYALIGSEREKNTRLTLHLSSVQKACVIPTG